MSFRIVGTGRAVPENTVTNRQLSELLDTSDEWIVTRTGIQSRYICTTESVTDLAAGAAEKAMKKAGVTANDIEMIICATLGGDYVFPSLACCVAGKLGANCPSTDLNAACTGFLYALNFAEMFYNGGKTGNILIICAERLSGRMDWRDRSTCVLFGDAAGACVLSPGESLKYMHLSVNSDAAPLYLLSPRGNSPFSPPRGGSDFTVMDGQAVFKFATRTLENEARRAFGSLGLSAEDMDLFLIHQANKRILEYVRLKLGQPPEKFPINLDRYGNVSAASIPILLDELLEAGEITPGRRLFLSAFGAGMTYGSCVLEW